MKKGRTGFIAAALLLLFGAAAAACNAPRPPAQKLPLELLKIKHPHRSNEVKSAASIVGVVLGADGRPVDFALVSAINVTDDPEDGRPPHLTTSLNHGKFELSSLPPGNYAITVSAPAANGAAAPGDASIPAAAFAGIVSAQPSEPGPPMLLRLGSPGVVLRGHVTDDAGAPLPNALVRAVRESPFEGDHFFAKTDPLGAFVLSVPRARYFVVGQAPGHRPGRVDLDMRSLPPDLVVALPKEIAVPTREDMAIWIRAAGGPLSSVNPADSELEPLKPMVKDARIVALGEASFTGAEHAKLAFRMFRYLVETMGFSVFLLEAGRADARALDDHVVKGTGKLKDLIASLGYYSLDTGETAAFFEWMRSYNQDPKHRTKLRVAGLDVQRTGAAATNLESYLASVDKTLLPPVETTLDRLRDNEFGNEYRRRPRDEQDRVAEDLDLIVDRLEKNRRVYIPKGYPAYENARDDAAALAWAARVYRDDDVRAAAMADMAKRTIDAAPRGTRFVIWAHNAQISKRDGDRGMGRFLSQTYSRDYVAVGMTFSQGWVRAWDYTSGATLDRGTKLFRLPPPGEATLEGLLDLSGVPMYFADVRNAPPALAPWFDARLSMWSVGATFVSDRRARARTVVREAFDALVYAKRLTSATFNPTSEREGRKE